MKRRDWDQQAANWIGWTRELGDDAYGDYAPMFWERFVPRGARRALDLGCGEGRSARDLARTSERAFGLDGSFTLVHAAARAGGAVRYVHGDAATLPFADATFDLVTAYNVLMDLDDLDASCAEIARVLTADGVLAACVLHPIAEAGTFEAREPGARFIIDESYFDEGDYRLAFSRKGHEITFSSSRYTLETYVMKLRIAGFAIEAVHEPKPDAEAIVRDPSEGTVDARSAVPLHLGTEGRRSAPHARQPAGIGPRRKHPVKVANLVVRFLLEITAIVLLASLAFREDAPVAVRIAGVVAGAFAAIVALNELLLFVLDQRDR